MALLAAFVAVTCISGVVIAGVQPEAWALTASFTFGLASSLTIGTALVGTVLRRSGSARV